MIDLQPFCGIGEIRDWLNHPFSIGEFSFATNGHILVRVPLRAGIGALTAQADVPRVLIGHSDVSFSPLGDLVLPALSYPRGTCPSCNGYGVTADGGECACCDGYGDLDAERRMSTTLRGVPFNLHYVRLLSDLPDVEIGAPSLDAALFFRFSGGVGALMPMRGRFGSHVEIER